MKFYLETSIFNRYFDVDPILHPATVQLFKEIAAGKFEPYTSVFVTDELEAAPKDKSEKMLNLIPKYKIKVLPKDPNAVLIANLSIDNKIIPERYRMDAMHIALSTVNGLDKIISLNFKHIVKDKTRTFTAYISTIYGYSVIDIKSPMEVIDND
ncbi:MAG: hypothetical protein LBR53_05540 [Deltaproteobacteria bacterium]|jgi:hypothetical protein|nr:hypothetical protein [Deltaproteobacteria bacterium]